MYVIWYSDIEFMTDGRVKAIEVKEHDLYTLLTEKPVSSIK